MNEATSFELFFLSVFLSLSQSSQREQLMVFGRYSYDALRQRVFLKEFGSFNNQTFQISAILLYREVKKLK